MYEMTTSWDYRIVALSIIMAIIGSYIALYFAGRLRNTKGRERVLWTSMGASIMGLAIWSMHFSGMLAMKMDMPVSYDPFLSFLSMIAAIVGSGIAFLILQRSAIGKIQYIFGSIAMGLAISTMHYTGMVSMRMAAKIVYDPLLFAASILVAIVASVGALWMAFRPIIGSTTSILVQKIGSAVAMGVAISGMHYTAMLAAHYIHTGVATGQAVAPTVGRFYLSDLLISALMIFGLALIVLSAYAFAERQRMFEELKCSERRFLSTFEQAAVGIGHIGSQGEFIRLNQKYCDILGYTHDELLGMTFQEITYPDDLSTDLDLYDQVKAKMMPYYTIEKRYIRKDGSLVWVNLTVSIVWNDEGKFDYAIAVGEDITQKKRSEEALAVYASKLEQSNRDLEQFATVASHDLQAPLRKVMVFSESLRTADGAKLSEEGLDYIERMQQATRRMQNLISDLLALSRINRRGHPFKPTELSTIVDAALMDLEGVIRETDAKVEVLGEFPKVEVDERQLQQVFLNLVENAIKFHKEDQAPVVKITSEIQGNVCRVAVQDNGIGFKPEQSRRIFEVFERLHGDAQYPGTGVGLAIVQKIIERHNGTISVQGQPNEGATFTVSFPLRQTVSPLLRERVASV